MPSGQRVNYDQIAHLYDEPIRDYAADPNLTQFLAEQPIATPRILDMGCGTGKQLTADSPAFPGASLVGLDRFQGMLRQAQKRGPMVTWVQGDSARAPFESAVFDYITNQFSYQHVLDKQGVIREPYRLLRPGGRFVMNNIDPWAMPKWIIYQYFPAAQDRDLEDFLPIEVLTARLEEVGFTGIQLKRDYRQVKENLAQFLQYASDRHHVSQLMVISDAEYEAGLASVKADVARLGDQAEVDAEFCLFTLWGDKPA